MSIPLKVQEYIAVWKTGNLGVLDVYPFKFIGWNRFAITDATVPFPDDNILRNRVLA